MENSTVTSPSVPVKDWLESGWILELRPQPGDRESRFWVGWGNDPTYLNDKEKSVLGAGDGLWRPPFFDDSNGILFRRLSVPTGNRPAAVNPTGGSTGGSVELSRSELEVLLFGGHWRQPVMPAVSRVDWDRSASKVDFAAGWASAMESITSGVLEKIVPVVFSRGMTATGDFSLWLLERLRFGLKGTADSRLRLYGSWHQSSGFLGATPEDLFRLERDGTEGARLTAMAVAGTRPIERSQELLKSDKDLNEHSIVVSHLRNALSGFCRDRGAALASATMPVVGRTEIESFGAIAHLVTELRCRVRADIGVSDIVDILHPTPALGLAPRSATARADLTRLIELDRLTAPAEARGGFGSPFIVTRGSVTEAVVSIRQVEFQAVGRDRIELRIGSGCGLVVGSDVEAEWNELSIKRRAVAELLGLQSENYAAVPAALDVVVSLVKHGIRDFVICAGARNAPLVFALDLLRARSIVQIHSFFDERSAAFFALGLSRRRGLKSVGVVTTSGTAATELTSAIAEADHSGVPLLALTADRPRRLRSSGSPQTIDQSLLYRPFVERQLDIEAGGREVARSIAAELAQWSRKRPVHINVGFDEPLDLTVGLDVGCWTGATDGSEPVSQTAEGAELNEAQLSDICEFIKSDALIAIVGRLEEFERAPALRFLRALKAPTWLEGPSGLRGHPNLKEFEITGDDGAITRAIRLGVVKRVLRIGGVPTLRAWRDLDEPAIECETLSVSRLRFSGLGRGRHIETSLKGLASIEAMISELPSSAAALRDSLLSPSKPQGLSGFSGEIFAEPLMSQLSKLIPQGAKVYIGNSLPIREWDRWATRDWPVMVEANRGVNGIDGQISTALGLAYDASGAGDELWILVGDLTALYDLNALWAPRPRRLRIVVINNGGGQIFRKVVAGERRSELFVNPHRLRFKGFAELWGLAYVVLDSQELSSRLSKERLQTMSETMSEQIVIEIIEK